MIATVVIVALILISAILVGLNFYTEYLEISEIGEQFVGVYLKNIFTKSITSVICFAFCFLIVYLSTLAVRKNLIKVKAESTILEKKLFIFLSSLIISLFQAFFLSHALYEKLLLFINTVPFGINDPITAIDLSYFVFQRPFLMVVTDSAAGILLFNLIYITILYFMLYIKIGERNINDLLISKPIILHLIVSAFIFLLTKSAGMWFEAQNIFTSSFIDLTGAGYVDINILYPAYRFAPFLLIIISIVSLFLLLRRKLKGAIITALLYVVFIVGVNVIAWATQVLYVSPNEVVAEEKYISHNINFTRYGYNLSEIEEYEYPVSETPSVDLNDEQVSNIRIVDFPATITATNQLQGIRSYYYFNDMDVGVYNINGKKEAVAIGAREISKENLDESARNYLNEKFRFTHGFGVSMAKINSVTSKGQPNYLIENLIQNNTEGIPFVAQPRIYFGQLTNDNVIVNTKVRELDYSEGTTDVEFDYDGTAGIKLDFWNKLLFSFKTGDLRMLIANQITPESRLLLNRNVIERVKSVAPFFKYDTNAVIVIDDDGTLKWVVDGFTTSSELPYSQYKNGYNYIRNSFKVTVDAYTGDVQFYIIDKNDPVILAYQKMYPTLFNEGNIPSSILAKSKYPESLFKTQCEMYTGYHITDPSIFYNKNDMYSIANEKYAQDVRSIEPYYNIIQLNEFNKNESELVLMLPFTLVNRENMVAWIAVGNEGNNYGKLISYKFPKNYTVYGPLQIENMIDNDPEISKEMTLWDSGGSNVIRGNLLVLPINNTILYVEPVYITTKNQASLPLLKRVIVGCGEEIVMAETLESALNQLFKQSSTTLQEPLENDAPVPEETDKVSAVIDAYSAVEEASLKGDWKVFGEAMDTLKKAISQLNQ